MDKPKATPKDFFLWAGAMVALYAGVVAFITLLFSYIDYVYPDPLMYWSDPYSSAAYQMAALIVLAPVFLILMRTIRRDIARDPSRAEVWVRRWALYLTVFVAGAAIVIDLITLIYTFLSGEELTVRFLLKVLVVLLVAGAGFLHFYADIKGYWAGARERAKLINGGVGVLVVASIIAGFFIIGTPGEARSKRMDIQRVADLQSIQWQVVNYWQQKESLPTTIEELHDPLSGYELPADPMGRAYTYKRNSPLDFTLCATFDAEGGENWGKGEPMPVRAYGSIEGTWRHGAGEQCFERSIDPERYPPYKI